MKGPGRPFGSWKPSIGPVGIAVLAAAFFSRAALLVVFMGFEVFGDLDVRGSFVVAEGESFRPFFPSPLPIISCG